MKHKKNFGKRIIASVMSAALLTVTAATQLSMQPDLTASAASDNYARLLQHSLYFYDANMCGTQVSENSAMEWRGDCHTADDADGGFHDAGDHAMFGLPQGYAASTLGWGYYEFKDAYDATGQGAHYKVINDYFADFFRASTKLDGSGNVTSFCYQKANGDTDHSYWGAPEDQTNDRKQYWTSNSASDIAAEYAAALALSYINFGNAEDLKYAEALYAFSTKYNSITTDGTVPFYDSSGCADDQAWAAGWLYLATNNEKYKSECASKQKQYLGWVHCWNETYLGAACVYAHITGDWSKVNSYLGGQCTGSNYWFLQQWGSARYNTTLQLCALVASKNSSADYTNWCKGQMDYILGNNPKNTCFVVGFADNSATSPHHRAASGFSGWNKFNSTTKFGSESHVLIGALVGGPTNASGDYVDSLQDAVANEVAVDYNAGFVGAAAGLYSLVNDNGVIDTSIPGVKKIYNGSAPVEPTTAPTTPSNDPTTQPTTQPTTNNNPSNENANINDMGSNIWEINVAGAEKVIITANMAANSTTNGCVGYAAGDWMQTNWDGTTDSSGNFVYEYKIPSGVTTLQFQVWWPQTVNKVSAVLVKSGTTDPTQPTTQPTTAPTTQPTTKPTTQPTTQPIGNRTPGDVNCDGSVSIIDVIFLNKHLMGSDKASAQGLLNADVDNDNATTPSDSLMILKSLVDLLKLS